MLFRSLPEQDLKTGFNQKTMDGRGFNRLFSELRPEEGLHGCILVPLLFTWGTPFNQSVQRAGGWRERGKEERTHVNVFSQCVWEV